METDSTRIPTPPGPGETVTVVVNGTPCPLDGTGDKATREQIIASAILHGAPGVDEDSQLYELVDGGRVLVHNGQVVRVFDGKPFVAEDIPTL
jgi:hypothetical protein